MHQMWNFYASFLYATDYRDNLWSHARTYSDMANVIVAKYLRKSNAPSCGTLALAHHIGALKIVRISQVKYRNILIAQPWIECTAYLLLVRILSLWCLLVVHIMGEGKAKCIYIYIYIYIPQVLYSRRAVPGGIRYNIYIYIYIYLHICVYM